MTTVPITYQDLRANAERDRHVAQERIGDQIFIGRGPTVEKALHSLQEAKRAAQRQESYP